MNNERLSDYYEDLKISPNADSETIDRVFIKAGRKVRRQEGG